MANWHYDLDQVLHRIFDSCAENNGNQASVDKLAIVMSQIYASEEEKQAELKEIIFKKLSIFSENEYISRCVFLGKFQLWVGEREPFIEERESIEEDSNNNLSFEEFNLSHPPCTSTPRLSIKANTICRKQEGDSIEIQYQLSSVSSKEDGSDRSKDRKALIDKNLMLESFLYERSEKIKKIRKKNDSLESRLTKSELRNQSLEMQIKKMANEYSQKKKRLMDEQINHVHLVAELEEKLKESEKRCGILSTENLRMKNDLDKCLCKELQQKNDDLLQKMKYLQKSQSSIKEKDGLIYTLKNELQKLNDAYQLNLKLILDLTNERESLVLSQEELISTIGELRVEKKNLQEKIDELLEEKEDIFSGVICGAHEKNYQDCEQRESGISVRSYGSFGSTIPERLDEIFSYSNARSATTDHGTQTEDLLSMPATTDLGTQTEDLLSMPATTDLGTQTEDLLSMPATTDLGTQTEDLLSMPATTDLGTQTEDLLSMPATTDLGTQTEDLLNGPATTDLCTQTEDLLSMYTTTDLGTQTEDLLSRYTSTDLSTQTEDLRNRYSSTDLGTQTENLLNRLETPGSPIPPLGIFNRRLKWRIVRQGFI